MSGIRSWVAVLFLVRSFKAVSGFRSWLLWKSILEPQDVACGLPLVGAGIMDADAVDQAQFLQLGEMFIQRRDRHFRIVGQPGLRREAAEIRVVPVAKEPPHDLGGGFQPALLDGPNGCTVAHASDLRVGLAIRVAKP